MQDFINFISQHNYLTSAVGGILILILLIEFIRANKQLAQLSANQAVHMINHEKAIVIDIRSQELFTKGHIIAAQFIPAAELKTSSKKLEKYKSKPLIIVCQTGVESQKITTRLIKDGYNAFSLASGMRGWIEAHLPIVKE